MFQIQIQNNKSPINKIGKDVETLSTLNGSFKDQQVDVLNPQILIEYSGNTLTKANYMTINELNRKYFIEEITSVRTNMWLIKAHVDVLDSFKDKILSNTAVVLRQENNFDLLLNDGVFKCKQNPRISYRRFPSGLGQFNYILLAAGGND